MTEHQRWFWRMDALDRCICPQGCIVPLDEAAYAAYENRCGGPLGLARVEFCYSMEAYERRQACPEWMRELFDASRAKLIEESARK